MEGAPGLCEEIRNPISATRRLRLSWKMIIGRGSFHYAGVKLHLLKSMKILKSDGLMNVAK